MILVFGEDSNDTESIKVLVRHLCPRAPGEVVVETRREPPSLTKGATDAKVRSWMDEIADLVERESRARVVHAVLVHQDSDGPDPSGKVEHRLAAELAAAIPGHATHAVVPVQMTEAWWLAFPDAVRGVKPTAWRQVKFPRQANTETIAEPKRELKRITRAASPKQEYSETDSVAIAEQIVTKKLSLDVDNPSWNRFVAVASAL
ncbi:MAG: hypothetical protein WBA05_18935 [Gordonia sp. (in: high G+C Gram-positive bacteria)]|uniref:hypothetical protein n=1 Tax=Gordonia TaxID=2053 RepID=UPI003267786A